MTRVLTALLALSLAGCASSLDRLAQVPAVVAAQDRVEAADEALSSLRAISDSVAARVEALEGRPAQVVQRVERQVVAVAPQAAQDAREAVAAVSRRADGAVAAARALQGQVDSLRAAAAVEAQRARQDLERVRQEAVDAAAGVRGEAVALAGDLVEARDTVATLTTAWAVGGAGSVALTLLALLIALSRRRRAT